MLHLCRQSLNANRTHGGHRAFTARHHRLAASTRCLWRYQSTKAAVNLISKTDDTEHNSPQAYTRPFAVEHVDGRARHLTWTDDGRVLKEWREIAEESLSPGMSVSERPQKSSKLSRVTAGLRQMFLPTNYPQSVHRS